MGATSVTWVLDDYTNLATWAHYLHLVQTLTLYAFPAGSTFSIVDFTGVEHLALTADPDAFLAVINNLAESGPPGGVPNVNNSHLIDPVDLDAVLSSSNTDITVVLGDLSDAGLSSCSVASDVR